MKNKILLLFIILVTVSLFSMCGLNRNEHTKKSTSVYDETITLQNMNYNEENNIYNIDYQKNLYDQIKNFKSSEKFTIENPLVIINPFETNEVGIYLYFETDDKSYVEYTIHVNENEINDFTNILYNGQKNNLTNEHEYVLIGGVAGKENIVTLNLYNKNSELYCTKTFKVTLPELDPGSDYILTKESGTSDENLSDGLFVTMGHINNENNNNNTYYYDNNGICRAQINLDSYRVDRLVFQNGFMYMSVSKNKIAALDRLGYVNEVYDLGKYEMHHDYILDDKGNLLILVSDTESDSAEDKVISLNLKNKDIKEIIDLGLLFPDIKEKAVLPEEKDKLDWVHVNSLTLVDNNTLLLSGRELSTIINVTNIYDEPKLNYLISDEKMWRDTDYYNIVYEKEGDFLIHGGQHTITVDNDNNLNKGQYYLYLYNNNTGVSSHYPDYDWNEAKDINTDSMYYKYLVDENEKTYSLIKKIDLLPSRYISSVQEYKNHIIADSGQNYTIYEFDSKDELIAKFLIEEKMWGLYRCFKYDFNNFYFYEI